MPSFGLGELILIALAIVLFVRPEDLPNFVRNIGRAYGELRRLLAKYQRYTQETLDEIARVEPNTGDTKKKPNIPENTESYECEEYQRAGGNTALEKLELEEPAHSAKKNS